MLSSHLGSLCLLLHEGFAFLSIEMLLLGLLWRLSFSHLHFHSLHLVLGSLCLMYCSLCLCFLSLLLLLGMQGLLSLDSHPLRVLFLSLGDLGFHLISHLLFPE